MHDLPVARYAGTAFDSNVSVLVPYNQEHVPAVYMFCSSEEFAKEIRRIDQKLNVTNATLTKIPFDLRRWSKNAQEKYPNGLPKPYSDNPTQWIFHGQPSNSQQPLHVALNRLLGYRWPAELVSGSGFQPFDPANKRQDGASTMASTMELSDEARSWIKRCGDLLPYADNDGIVCIPSVRGEEPASGRLQTLLTTAYGSEWSPSKLDELLARAACMGKSLDYWLREKFFEQHCALFHQRPFIWHIWDGIKRDGFGALVNYHKLDRKLLETLTYNYLGDWIKRQEDGVRNGVDGAGERLDAARNLQHRLELILEGEAPYDIFVRWKPIEEQPVGWEPDLNDGVRLNIRPFVQAGVLRKNPRIKWNKDRGKDVESSPWFHLFKGDRINDHHLTIAEKLVAREPEIDRR